jgi:hypothetical protein
MNRTAACKSSDDVAEPDGVDAGVVGRGSVPTGKLNDNFTPNIAGKSFSNIESKISASGRYFWYGSGNCNADETSPALTTDSAIKTTYAKSVFHSDEMSGAG